VRAVDSVSLDVAPGELLGIAGESGSGKSTLGQALLRTLPPPAVISRGTVRFEGRDLLALDERSCGGCAGAACPWCSRARWIRSIR
jgi:peptide/nickel transport system ATP-binding protein